MKNTLMLFAALGGATVGALLSSAAFLFVAPAASQETAPLPHHHQGRHHQSQGAMPCCAVSPGNDAAAFYSDMAGVNSRMHEGMEVTPSGDINQDFIRMMIPHHQGAIDMALVLLKHEPDERLKRLAQSIIVEQGQEIAYMRTLQNPSTTDPSKPPSTPSQPQP
jgi:uncharacterized protein (DUF305 family)